MVFQKYSFSYQCEKYCYGLKARRFPKKDHARVGPDWLNLWQAQQPFGVSPEGGAGPAVANLPLLLMSHGNQSTNVQLIEQLILELNKDTEMTIIIVTHNIFQARRVAREVVFLHEGHIVEAGETKKIFTSPEDPRTKAFVEGRMVY